MDAREFFEAIIKNMPSRGLDYVEVYIHEETEEDPICYEITDISNDGSNDGLYITIKKV
jgi:hypothetical protein